LRGGGKKEDTQTGGGAGGRQVTGWGVGERGFKKVSPSRENDVNEKKGAELVNGVVGAPTITKGKPGKEGTFECRWGGGGGEVRGGGENDVHARGGAQGGKKGEPINESKKKVLSEMGLSARKKRTAPNWGKKPEKGGISQRGGCSFYE